MSRFFLSGISGQQNAHHSMLYPMAAQHAANMAAAAQVQGPPQGPAPPQWCAKPFVGEESRYRINNQKSSLTPKRDSSNNYHTEQQQKPIYVRRFETQKCRPFLRSSHPDPNAPPPRITCIQIPDRTESPAPLAKVNFGRMPNRDVHRASEQNNNVRSSTFRHRDSPATLRPLSTIPKLRGTGMPDRNQRPDHIGYQETSARKKTFPVTAAGRNQIRRFWRWVEVEKFVIV